MVSEERRGFMKLDGTVMSFFSLIFITTLVTFFCSCDGAFHVALNDVRRCETFAGMRDLEIIGSMQIVRLSPGVLPYIPFMFEEGERRDSPDPPEGGRENHFPFACCAEKSHEMRSDYGLYLQLWLVAMLRDKKRGCELELVEDMVSCSAFMPPTSPWTVKPFTGAPDARVYIERNRKDGCVGVDELISTFLMTDNREQRLQAKFRIAQGKYRANMASELGKIMIELGCDVPTAVMLLLVQFTL